MVEESEVFSIQSPFDPIHELNRRQAAVSMPGMLSMLLSFLSVFCLSYHCSYFWLTEDSAAAVASRLLVVGREKEDLETQGKKNIGEIFWDPGKHEDMNMQLWVKI